MEYIEILGYVIGVIGIIFGAAFAIRWQQMVKVLKELGEAFTDTASALEDKQLTKEESLLLLQQWQDVVSSFVTLIGRRKE